MFENKCKGCISEEENFMGRADYYACQGFFLLILEKEYIYFDEF